MCFWFSKYTRKIKINKLKNAIFGEGLFKVWIDNVTKEKFQGNINFLNASQGYATIKVLPSYSL